MLTNLLAAAMAAPSADNSQPWSFDWDGRDLSIRHRPPQAPDPFGPGGHAVLLSVGHVLANVADFLEAAGTEPRIRWSPEPQNGGPYATVRLPDPLPGPIPGLAGRPDLPSTLRHTNRFPYSTSSIPEEARRLFAGATPGTARVALMETPGSRTALAAIAERCSGARFCTRELHEWLAACLRFSPESVAQGDGLDIRTLHLPPGGGAFLRLTKDWRVMRQLNRLGIYRMLAAGETVLLRQAPMQVCIVGTMDAAGVIDAGGLLARVWVGLNALGIAVHPYYVVTDQQLRLEADRVPAEWRDVLGNAMLRLPSLLELGPDEMLHMILRVGWPTVTPRRSRRLPPENVFRDLTKSVTP